MSNEKETIEDIVADIRAQNKGLPEDGYALSPLVCDLLRIADRIEAAAKSIEADRDNWRRQALDEDARANAATIKDSLTVGTTAALARSTIPNAEQFAQQAECARHGVVTATVYRVLTPEGVCVAEFTDAVRACDYGDVLRASVEHYKTDKEI